MKQLVILAVEDDEADRELVRAAFEEDGHLVCAAASIGECRRVLQKIKVDMIVLDRGLPDGDGIQLCMALRKDPCYKIIPILMLTGQSAVNEKILGLRWGADDYLAKPFDIEELRARAGAIARRVYGEKTAILAACGITMDLKAKTVAIEDTGIALTGREFSLLRVFMENPDTVLSRDFLLATVWKDAAPPAPKVVDVTVGNLRRKLGEKAVQITAVRSSGYRFISARGA